MLSYLFSFEGRISRGGWWLGGLIQSVLLLIPFALWLPVVMKAIESRARPDPAAFGSSWPLLLCLLALWIGLAIQAKRWHDLNYSGFRTLYALIPLLGPLYVFVHVALLRGSDGSNDYGPPPGSPRGARALPDEPEVDADAMIARYRQRTAREIATSSPAPATVRTAMAAPMGRPVARQGFGRRGLA